MFGLELFWFQLSEFVMIQPTIIFQIGVIETLEEHFGKGPFLFQYDSAQYKLDKLKYLTFSLSLFTRHYLIFLRRNTKLAA